MQDSDIQALDGYKSWSGIKLAFTEEPPQFFHTAFAGGIHKAELPIYVLDASYELYSTDSSWNFFTITKLSERT